MNKKNTFAVFFFDGTAVSNCTFQSIIVNIMSLQLQSSLRPKKHFHCFFQLFWSAVDFLVQNFSSEEMNTENIHSWETKEPEKYWQLHMLRISSSLGFSDMIFTHSLPSTLSVVIDYFHKSWFISFFLLNWLKVSVMYTSAPSVLYNIYDNLTTGFETISALDQQLSLCVLPWSHSL